MKRIITAMGNPALNNELGRYSEYDIVEKDLFYQEAVIDALNTKEVDAICVSGILQGQWDLFEFVEKIREARFGIRIILVLDEEDMNIKCELLERGIQDIFFDDSVEVSDIIHAINREEPLLKQLEINRNQTISQEERENVQEPMIIQKQEIIAISGVNGSGKTTIAYQFSKNLAMKTNSKILVIDFDILNGNIEELFDVEKVPENIEMKIDIDKKCGLNYAADLIKKKRFDANVFDEIVMHVGNIDLLTGNTSLYFCQECLNEPVYEQILECAKTKYDFIILDTSSNIFLDATKWTLEKATKVFFVMEADKISLRKTTQLLDVFVNMWGIWKEKFYLVINKVRTGEMPVDVIENIFKEYSFAGEIKQNQEKETDSYHCLLEKIHFMKRLSFKEKCANVKNKIITQIEKNKKCLDNKKRVAENVN